MSKCENPTCQKDLKAEEDGLTCAHCRDPLYCSRKCQAMDWVRHKCPNAVDAPSVASTIFVPYHFEDLLSQEHVEQLDARDKVHQSYSIRTISEDMHVEHRVQESLLASQTDFVQAESAQRGSVPEEETGHYNMEVSFDDAPPVALQGLIPQNLIFPSNETNVQAKLLGGGRIQADATATTRWNKISSSSSSSQSNLRSFAVQPEGLIYWQNNLSINMPLKGIASIALDDMYLEAPYDFSYESKMSKLVKSNFESQLVNKQIAPSPLVKSIRATDVDGNTVVLTALVGQENATLLDVEFREGVPLESDISKVLLDCDPNNVNHMVGLAMGLELLAASNAQFQELADTVGDFARRKMDNPSLNATPEVASAVTEAVEALHEEFMGAEGGKDGFLSRAKRRFKNWRRRAKSAAVKSRGTRKVRLQARRIKKNKDLTESEKQIKLQALYDEQLNMAKHEQEQNQNTASEYIDRATEVYNEAKTVDEGSGPIRLLKRTEELTTYMKTAQENSQYKRELENLLNLR